MTPTGGEVAAVVLHQDALGNVDTITDGHGQVVQRVAFKPFGERTVTLSKEGSSAWSDTETFALIV